MSPSVSPEAINVVNGKPVYYDKDRQPYVISTFADSSYRVYVGPLWREAALNDQRRRIHRWQGRRHG